MKKPLLRMTITEMQDAVSGIYMILKHYDFRDQKVIIKTINDRLTELIKE